MLLLRGIPSHAAKTFTNSVKKNITEIIKIITKKSLINSAVFSLNLKSLTNKPINLLKKIVIILKKISNTPKTRIISIITFVDKS